jgi:aryl-alcohol dehydrogenase-like predicted oxidoreductase
MQTRTLGTLGPVSALALGGGGIGAVWGDTSRAEAIATTREAVEAGITLLDLAPSYGDGEAETVGGEAFGGNLPAGVRVTTKCQLGDTPAAEVYDQLSASLTASLQRLQLDRVDIFILHSNIVPDGAGSQQGTPISLFRETVRPAFQRIVQEDRAGAWGITGIGWPSSVRSTLADDQRPAIVQCIANLLDSGGGLRRSEEPLTPRETISLARQQGVGVMGIRAVQAGALTDAFDRDLPDSHPDMADFHHAAPFRAIATELGVGAAHLAHRYALSIEGVDTLVLGVKNREELHDCLAAEAAVPLEPALIQRIDKVVGRAQ